MRPRRFRRGNAGVSTDGLLLSAMRFNEAPAISPGKSRMADFAKWAVACASMRPRRFRRGNVAAEVWAAGVRIELQ